MNQVLYAISCRKYRVFICQLTKLDLQTFANVICSLKWRENENNFKRINTVVREQILTFNTVCVTGPLLYYGNQRPKFLYER